MGCPLQAAAKAPNTPTNSASAHAHDGRGAPGADPAPPRAQGLCGTSLAPLYSTRNLRLTNYLQTVTNYGKTTNLTSSAAETERERPQRRRAGSRDYSRSRRRLCWAGAGRVAAPCGRACPAAPRRGATHGWEARRVRKGHHVKHPPNRRGGRGPARRRRAAGRWGCPARCAARSRSWSSSARSPSCIGRGPP